MPASPPAALSAAEALFLAFRAEQSKLDELMSVGQAESPASNARLAELKELQDAAHQRWTVASDIVATARETGDVDEIAAARVKADKEYWAYDTVADQCIAEAHKIIGERTAALGKVLDQMKIKEDAYSAWLASLGAGRQ